MEKIRVFTSFSGYDSQCMALDRIGVPYELVGWSEIDKYAIQAHNAVYPQWADRNYGDICKIDWNTVPDFDMFTYSSPCFAAGTLVRTDAGLKPIEDIKAGYQVLTHENRFRKVVRLMRTPHGGNLCKLTATGIGDIECTADHRFYVRKKMKCENKWTLLAPEWIEAKDLDSGCLLGYPINSEERLPSWDGVTDNRWGHHRISNKISRLFVLPEFWYLMGRYVGDGWKRSTHTGKGIVICCSDRNRNSLVSALAKLELCATEVNERTVTKMQIASNELYSFVERYGYYAHGKHIDGDTMNLPVSLLKSFLDGYVDSDGCMVGDLFKVTTVSGELARDLVQLIAKVYHRPARLYFSIRPHKATIEGREVNQRDTWQVVWRTKVTGHEHSFYEDGLLWMPVRKLSLGQSVSEVYNLEVEEDNSYTANGAAVHNCQDFSAAGLQRGGAEGSGTRSSLLWECKKAITAKHPKYLLMENVKNLVSDKFIRDFRRWEQWLASQGYANYCKVLDAVDFGVPQKRERIFVVSFLNDERFYQFPAPLPLTHSLTHSLDDLLEENIDDKYYLSEKSVAGFEMHNERHIEKGTGFLWKPHNLGGGIYSNDIESECGSCTNR